MISSKRQQPQMPAIMLMIAAICMFSAASAFAQGQGQGQGGGGAGGGRAGARGGQGRGMGPALIDRMHTAVNELGLSDEQKPKMDEIFAKAKDDLAKMQPELQDLPAQERGARVREFTQKLVSDVKGVLNDEQKAKFDQRVAELQQQRGGAGGGQGAGQGGQMRRMREAAASLDLSPEQKTKVDEILSKAEKDVEQARQESQGDPEAMREKARAIGQNTTAALEQVLTPEQQTQFRESMRAARGTGNGDGQGARERRGGGAGPASQPANPPATQPEKKTSDR